MEKTFVAEREERPGAACLARFHAGRDEAARWYRGVGLSQPPTASECRAALQRYMPELVPSYDDVCRLVGDDDLAHLILSHTVRHRSLTDAAKQFGSEKEVRRWCAITTIPST